LDIPELCEESALRPYQHAACALLEEITTSSTEIVVTGGKFFIGSFPD